MSLFPQDSHQEGTEADLGSRRWPIPATFGGAPAGNGDPPSTAPSPLLGRTNRLPDTKIQPSARRRLHSTVGGVTASSNDARRLQERSQMPAGRRYDSGYYLPSLLLPPVPLLFINFFFFSITDAMQLVCAICAVVCEIGLCNTAVIILCKWSVQIVLYFFKDWSVQIVYIGRCMLARCL